MWKELFTFIQTVITLSKEQNQIRGDIKELQTQLTHLILKIQTLNDQIIMNQERQTATITVLKKDLEIELLQDQARVEFAKSVTDEAIAVSQQLTSDLNIPARIQFSATKNCLIVMRPTSNPARAKCDRQ